MRRRDVLVLVGGFAASWPIASWAQRAQPVVGFLHSGSPERFAATVQAFRDGLREEGFAEGQNVGVEYRWANGQNERLPALADELLRRPVDLIVSNRIAAQAAKAVTATTPIVFESGVDPVRVLLVATLARPGANVTGVSFVTLEAKKLEILHELVPQHAMIGALLNPRNEDVGAHLDDLQTAANMLARKLVVLQIGSESEFEPAFQMLTRQGVKVAVVAGDSFFDDRRSELIALAVRYSIGTIYSDRRSVDEGGLMSYGSDREQAFRLVGNYAGRILKGAKPADLPVVQPRRVHLVINLKTAKTLGLDLPQALLDRADELIE